MMILRLPAQGAFFFHGSRVALAIVAIVEGKLPETAKSKSFVPLLSFRLLPARV